MSLLPVAVGLACWRVGVHKICLWFLCMVPLSLHCHAMTMTMCLSCHPQYMLQNVASDSGTTPQSSLFPITFTGNSQPEYGFPRASSCHCCEPLGRNVTFEMSSTSPPTLWQATSQPAELSIGTQLPHSNITRVFTVIQNAVAGPSVAGTFFCLT